MLTLAGFAELASIIVLVVGTVFGTCAAMGGLGSPPPRALKAVVRGSSVAMAGAAAIAVR